MSQEVTIDIPAAVETAWAAVFETANTVIHAHAAFGFSEFEAKINPSITHLLMGLKVVESVLDTIYASDLLDYSEKRLILNAKQQIGLIQRVAEALKDGKNEDYEAAIAALTAQAQMMVHTGVAYV